MCFLTKFLLIKHVEGVKLVYIIYAFNKFRSMPHRETKDLYLKSSLIIIYLCISSFGFDIRVLLFPRVKEDVIAISGFVLCCIYPLEYWCPSDRAIRLIKRTLFGGAFFSLGGERTPFFLALLTESTGVPISRDI